MLAPIQCVYVFKLDFESCQLQIKKNVLLQDDCWVPSVSRKTQESVSIHAEFYISFIHVDYLNFVLYIVTHYAWNVQNSL